MAFNFDALKNSLAESAISTESTDVLGGRTILPSNIYHAEVKEAYFTTSTKGSQGLVIVLNIQLENGDTQEFTNTIWFTSSETKGPYYIASNGEKKGLPGYYTVNDFCQLTVGKPLTECSTEEKIAEVWDNGNKEKKSVDALSDCAGSDILVAISAVEQNKWSANGPTDEKITVNTIDKFFCHSDKRTVHEITKDLPSKFYNEWLSKFKDKVVNKFKPTDKPTSGIAVATAAPASKEQMAKNLFS